MSNVRLKGKVAIVTGAGQGIGLGIARRSHKDGATIVIAEYDAAKGRNAAESMQRGTFIETDVTRPEQVPATRRAIHCLRMAEVISMVSAGSLRRASSVG